MNINKLKESKYLSKEDCSPPLILTISGLSNTNMAKEGEPEENKYILHFSENVKPMVLNITNGKLIAHVTGEEDTDNWIGKKITLFHDRTVPFGAELVGGIRVQVPQEQAQAPEREPGMDDDINF